MRHGFVILRSLLLAGLLTAAGCASAPYQRGTNDGRPPRLMLRDGEPQIEVGRPNWVIDGLGNIISIPNKLLLLNMDVDSHRIHTNTVNLLAQYLDENELGDVKIRVNQYAPGGEWSRLFRNRSIGVVWRYTLGLINTLVYTIVPGRLIGGDNYNPYTHTISLYSNSQAIALHEGAHAKDLADRRFKGTYAFMRMLPLVTLKQEADATGEALAYLRAHRDTEQEQAAYKILYPAYGSYVGGELQYFYTGPSSFILGLSMVIPGHIIGWHKAGHVQAQDRAMPDQSDHKEPRTTNQEQAEAPLQPTPNPRSESRPVAPPPST